MRQPHNLDHFFHSCHLWSCNQQQARCSWRAAACWGFSGRRLPTNTAELPENKLGKSVSAAKRGPVFEKEFSSPRETRHTWRPSWAAELGTCIWCFCGSWKCPAVWCQARFSGSADRALVLLRLWVWQGYFGFLCVVLVFWHGLFLLSLRFLYITALFRLWFLGTRNRYLN